MDSSSLIIIFFLASEHSLSYFADSVSTIETHFLKGGAGVLPIATFYWLSHDKCRFFLQQAPLQRGFSLIALQVSEVICCG
jgi:hypothetical protein